MKKQYMKSALILAASILTVIGIAAAFERCLDREIDQMYDSARVSRAINLQSADMTKDKGGIILKKSMESDNLILMGSSELSSPVDQNPCYAFPNATLPANLTTVGRAYTQSLLHGMKAAHTDFQGEKKLAIVVSLQWFFDEDIDKDGFAANFSEYHFLGMMNNRSISNETKQKACSRTYELLRSVNGYDDIKTYAWLYQADNGVSRAVLHVLKPYYRAKEWLLQTKDKWNTWKLLKNLKETDQKEEIREINWEEAYQAAGEEGKARCTSNEFNVEDEYYNAYLKDAIVDLKDDSKDAKLQSKELGDYELFLEICKENQVEPYIIIMNTNGKYYDYIGVNQERRNKLYDYIETEASKYGFESLRLSEYEYEPYFMYDVMHLGWKGWLRVNEEMSAYFADDMEQ